LANLTHTPVISAEVSRQQRYDFSAMVKNMRCLILWLFSWISHYGIVFRTGMHSYIYFYLQKYN